MIYHTGNSLSCIVNPIGNIIPSYSEAVYIAEGSFHLMAREQNRIEFAFNQSIIHQYQQLQNVESHLHTCWTKAVTGIKKLRIVRFSWH